VSASELLKKVPLFKTILIIAQDAKMRNAEFAAWFVCLRVINIRVTRARPLVALPAFDRTRSSKF
jgi:hypothetical protein